MAVKKVTVTEDDAWAEIDKLMVSPAMEKGERDILYYMNKFNIKRNLATDRMVELEAKGLITSRMVLLRGHWTRVYKPVKR